MDKGLQYCLFLILCLSISHSNFSQSQKSFSGELHYIIERVDKKDSVKAEMIIFAKDSMLRIVNFNSETGKQELIKHLRLNKSYLLIDTPKQKFAVRTNEHLEKDTIVDYNFRKRLGFKRIAGLTCRKFKVKQKMVKNELNFYVYNKIPSYYLNAFKELPGLPTLYFVANDHGLFKYTLKEIKRKDPPSQLFTFGIDYKIVTFEEFSEEFSRLYESE
jgi:hypothetical protein